MRSVTARQGSQSLSRAKAPSRTQKSASFRLDAGFFFGILATCNNRAAPIGKQLASTSARANSSTFSVLDASSCSSCLSCARSPQQIHNQACVPAQSPSMRLGSGPCDFHQCIWMRGMAQETGNRSLMGDSVVASRASPPSPVVPGCRNGNGERWTDDYPTNSFLHVVDPQPPSCRSHRSQRGPCGQHLQLRVLDPSRGSSRQSGCGCGRHGVGLGLSPRKGTGTYL